jgi:hypothetical protein
VNSNLLAHYISKKAAQGSLENWTVVLLGRKDEEKPSGELALPTALLERSDETPKDDRKYTVQRLLSPLDEKYGLDDAALDRALEETRNAWAARPVDKRSEEEPEHPSGPKLREQRSPQKGLLLLYPLDPSKIGGISVPIVGFGISFPGDKLNPEDGVEYEANLVYVGKELGDEDFD